MVPLISTSELRTLRPLGLGALLAEELDTGLLEVLGFGEDEGELAGAMLLFELLAESADSDFCPITF